MINFELNGKSYQIDKLDAFAQLHIARKLGPAMPLIEGMVDKDNAAKDLSLLMLMSLSHIDDASCEYVVQKCLSAISIKQDKGWAKLAVNGALMFDDTTVEEMLKLTAKVVDHNLGDFFRTALGDLSKAAVDQPAS